MWIARIYHNILGFPTDIYPCRKGIEIMWIARIYHNILGFPTDIAQCRKGIEIISLYVM